MNWLLLLLLLEDEDWEVSPEVEELLYVALIAIALIALVAIFAILL